MTKEKDPQDVFNDAFDEIMGVKTETPGQPLEEPKEGDQGESNDPEVPPVEEGEKEPEQPVQKEEPNTEHSGEPAPPPEIDYKEMYEKEVHRTRSWEGRIRAANDRTKELEDKIKSMEEELKKRQEVKPSPTQAPEVETDVDLKQFFEDYPELVKPFNKLVEGKSTVIARQIIDEEFAKIRPTLQKVETQIADDVEARHWRDIQAAHPDWQQIAESGELPAFIETQPAIIKREYERVYRNGSSAEVIELLQQYKNSKPGKPTTPPKPPKSPEHLVSVPPAPRQVPLKGAPKDDFDAGWEEAIGKRK